MDNFKTALYPAVTVVALVVVACQPTAGVAPTTSVAATPAAHYATGSASHVREQEAQVAHADARGQTHEPSAARPKQ
jgi:hypothetical protein